MIVNGREDLSFVPRTPPLTRLVKLAFLLGLLSFTSRQLNLGSWSLGGVTILWPTNGFLLGVLLCNQKRQWPAYLAVGFLIDFGVNISLGDSIGIAAYMSSCNLLEVLLAAVPLYSIVAPKPNLTERRQLLPFMMFGVVLAPGVASLLAGLVSDGHFVAPTLENFHHWFTADALGIATVTPLYLAFNQRDRFSGRSWREIAGLFALLLAVTFAVFWQTRFPLLFIVLPFLLLLGVRLGLAGSALGLLLVSIVGGFLSTAGHGPVALVRTNTLSERDLIFQCFIATAMLLLYIVEVSTGESKQLQANLQGSERRFRLLAEASSDIIVLTDLEGKRNYVSPAVVEVLGWQPEQVLGGSFRESTHPDDIAAFQQLFEDCAKGKPTRPLEYRSRKADGSYLWLEINPRLYHDVDRGAPAGFVNVVRDISRRKQSEEEQQRAFEEAEYLAGSDALTGIANRRQFDTVLEKEWMRAAREESVLSLLLIDVDRFKPYNDVYGHLTGDECLRQVVAAVRKVISRPADLLARYGGEEFVVVLPGTDAVGACQMGEWVRQAVEQQRLPHPGNPPHAVITLSVGCASLLPGAKLTHLDLLESADRALYGAKAAGRNCVRTAGRVPGMHSTLLTG